MADDLRDDVTTRAALAAGRDAAKRAVEDLLSTDEEKAQREAEQQAASKSRRNKIIAFGVVGLLLVLGVVGLVLAYWKWFMLLGLLGAGGLYGWYRLRRRDGSEPKAEERDETAEATQRARVEEEALTQASAERDEEVRQRSDELLAEQQRAERAREAEARAEAQALEAQEIDDELAAMKARLRKK